MKSKLLLSLVFLSLLPCQQIYSQDKKWVEFKKDSIYSSLDGEVQYFYHYQSSQKNQPLIVSLHQWGADYKEYSNSLAPQAKSRDWNYIHPDFRGSNKHIKACGSEYVISDVDDAIDWAIQNLNVDKERIYVVGASGGGYAALCCYMKSRHKIREYSVWVPISDLEKWYYESKSRKSHYANNIIRCTCGDCSGLDTGKARARSPLYWNSVPAQAENTKLKIYAGVLDGYSGSVPITHSIFFYNKLVSDLGGKETDKVSDAEIIWLLTARTTLLNKEKKWIGNRSVLYNKSYKTLSITVFDGGHEILADEVLNLID